MVSVNGYIIGNECFPNNERILKSINIGEEWEYNIVLKYETDIDISILVMVKKYLDDVHMNSVKNLIMKYVPYSRMDRKIEGYMFSLKYFCQIINDLKFDSVVVLDTHSNVTTALLDRCSEISISYHIDKIIFNNNIDYVFYPDNGACKRYSEILKLPNSITYFYGNKKRNLQTGEILTYELVDVPNLINKNVLIIDDLCAFGGTFIGASEKLREHGASKVILYVSHCENSIYKGKLLKSGLIDKIYTTDSILNDWSSGLIYKIEN